MIAEPRESYGPLTREALQRSNALHSDSFVYFVADVERGLVKIGITRDVAKRFKALQTSQGGELKLLGCLAGGRELESELHSRFKEYRRRGEWFEANDDLDELVRDAFRAATNRQVGDSKKPIKDRAPSEAAQLEGIVRRVVPREEVREFARVMGIGEQEARRMIGRIACEEAERRA